MSNSLHSLHRRREDAVIVVGASSIGAVTGRAVVAVSIVASIATIIIVSTVVDFAMIPRPPKSPIRTEVPARWDVPSGQRHRVRVGRAKQTCWPLRA
eukprot:7974424-Pyramimonas_sp.AAC.1